VVPALTPVTDPDVPIVATPVLLLLQVPPEVASVRVVLARLHTLKVPPIAGVLPPPVKTSFMPGVNCS